MHKSLAEFSNLLINQIFLSIFLWNFFHIKKPKDSSAKYYQDNEERLQEKAHERCQSLSKEEKGKKQH